MKQKMNVLKKGISKLLILLLTVSIFYDPAVVSASKVTKSITVTNQKELDSALANKDITSITIKTNKKLKFKISDKDYSNKRLYYKAAHSTIVNEGEFKSVNIIVNTPFQLKKALENKTINAGVITIASTKKINFEIPKGKYDVNLIVKAPKSDIVFEGDFKEVNTFVSTQEELEKALKNGKNTAITIDTDKKVDIKVPEGDYSAIKLVVEAPNVTITVNKDQFKDTVVKNDTVNIIPVEKVEEKVEVPVVSGGSSGGGFSGGGSSQPSTPSVPELTEEEKAFIETKNSYIESIKAESLALKPYIITGDVWAEFNNGLISEYVDKGIATAKTSEELEKAFSDAKTEIRYYRNDNVIIYKEDIEDYVTRKGIEKTEDNTYDFYKEDGRRYIVDANDLDSINRLKFNEDELTIATSGPAITFMIDAFNNVMPSQTDSITNIRIVFMKEETGGYESEMDIGMIKGKDWYTDYGMLVISKEFSDAIINAETSYKFEIETILTASSEPSVSNYIWVHKKGDLYQDIHQEHELTEEEKVFLETKNLYIESIQAESLALRPYIITGDVWAEFNNFLVSEHVAKYIATAKTSEELEKAFSDAKTAIRYYRNDNVVIYRDEIEDYISRKEITKTEDNTYHFHTGREYVLDADDLDSIDRLTFDKDEMVIPSSGPAVIFYIKGFNNIFASDGEGITNIRIVFMKEENGGYESDVNLHMEKGRDWYVDDNMIIVTEDFVDKLNAETSYKFEVTTIIPTVPEPSVSNYIWIHKQ